MSYNRPYEIHITVEDFPSMKQANEFSEFVHTLGGKALLIELYNPRNKPNVANPLQLMMGINANFPDDNTARLVAEDLQQQITKAGWNVVRVKLESPLGPGYAVYYETHWKLDLSLDYEWQYAELCKFLYHNPYYLRSKNLFDRGSYFLSQREYHVYKEDDHVKAAQKFNELGVGLSFNGQPLKKVHYERVIWDSNPKLDNGWSAC